jgi:hypothetical protein
VVLEVPKSSPQIDMGAPDGALLRKERCSTH